MTRALAANGLITIPGNPTAENMASFLAKKFRTMLVEEKLIPASETAVAVSVHETSHGKAYAICEE